MLIKEFDLPLDDKDDDTLVVGVEIHQGKYSPSLVWEQRAEWTAFVENSKGYWDKMTDEQREAVTLVIKHAMQRMHDKIEIWLPEGMDTSSGNYVDIHFKIMLTDADKEIQKHSALTNMRLQEAQVEAHELLQKLRENAAA